ncbi:hypothetical protein DMENIID0001_128650 [Sergentomyia squamirostris]
MAGAWRKLFPDRKTALNLIKPGSLNNQVSNLSSKLNCDMSDTPVEDYLNIHDVALTDEDLLELEQEDSPEDVDDSIEEVIGFSEFARNEAMRNVLEDMKKKIIYLKVLDTNFDPFQ